MFLSSSKWFPSFLKETITYMKSEGNHNLHKSIHQHLRNVIKKFSFVYIVQFFISISLKVLLCKVRGTSIKYKVERDERYLP